MNSRRRIRQPLGRCPGSLPGSWAPENRVCLASGRNSFVFFCSAGGRLCAGCVQVFGRRNAEPIHALWRPASEKRQGTKSRWVGHWRCRGLYGELSGASGSKRMTRSGRAHVFGPRRGCPCRAERADRGFVDRNGAGDAGQSDGPTQAGTMPVEIRRECLASLRWRIGGDGIMRCRS